MKYLYKRLISIFTILSLIFIYPSLFCLSGYADNQRIEVAGTYYEFDENSKYEISSTAPISDMDHTNLGTISVEGNINNVSSRNGVPAYEIADEEVFSLSFSYNDSLKNADEKSWHLYDDGKEEVDGISLPDDVGYGAIIFQTSLDKTRWVTNYKSVNISGDITFNASEYINNIQLLNGCYYRIILAYELQKKNNPDNLKFIIWDTPIKVPDNEYKKNAEVYEFFASYKDMSYAIPDNIETYSIGKIQAVAVDTGYNTNIDISKDDPHFGWDLGTFVIGGFTKYQGASSNDVTILKNLGDKVTLWFKMNSSVDINKLNNDDKLSIHSDSNSCDTKLGVPLQDFKRGALIVRFTDYKGVKHDPIVYTNFLEALACPGADTRIQLYEEGDYEVSLDYEILNDKIVDKLYDYKISFTFHIRNSNTMVYAKDILTKTYLANDSVSENGFVLDWAKSRYLRINVQLSQWTKGVNGYTEDLIFNREAKETDEYTKSGIYTITVSNPTTDPNEKTPTIKRIYVGTDNVLIAAMKNSSYSINQISNMVDNEGYQISRMGDLIPPIVTEQTTTTMEQTTTTTALTTDSTPKDTSSVTTTQKHDSSTTTNNSSEATISMTETNAGETEKIIDEPSEKTSPLLFICIGGTGVLSILAFVLWKSKKA